MEEENLFPNYHNHNKISTVPKKNYTCKETEKCDPYTGKAAGNRNCERAQMSHLIDTGFKEATINIFKGLNETRIKRGKNERCEDNVTKRVKNQMRILRLKSTVTQRKI